MELVLTDEQRLLRDSAGKFIERHAGPKAHRRVRETAAGFDAARLHEAAAAGWLGLVVPEAAGGLGLGATELAIVAEEAGRGLMTEPVAAIAASARTIADGGNDALTEALLPKLIAGETVIIPVLPEASGGSAGEPTFSASATSGGGLRLSGAARFVPGAESAGGFIVAAAIRDGTVLVHLRRDGAAQAGGRRTVDGGNWSGLKVDNLEIAAADIVAGPNAGAATLETMRGYLLTGLAAEMLGIMEQALDLALGYLKTRVQFNRPIGSFQALQHRAVNDYMEVELTRSLLYQVCAAIDAGRGTPAMVAALKSRASEAVISVTKSAIQMHGAIGFTDEYDAGLYLRRAMALAVQHGDTGTHRKRFAELAAG